MHCNPLLLFHIESEGGEGRIHTFGFIRVFSDYWSVRKTRTRCSADKGIKNDYLIYFRIDVSCLLVFLKLSLGSDVFKTRIKIFFTQKKKVER